MKINFAVLFSLVFFSTAFVLIMLETAIRLTRPQKIYSNIIEIPGVYRASTYLTLDLAPNARMRQKSDEFDNIFQVNPDGFRDPLRYSPTPEYGTKRYLAMGDSFTVGHGVSENEAWPKVLEKILNKEGSEKVEVMNTAYACGFSPDTYALYYKRKGFSYGAHSVIVGFFTWNDIDDLRNNIWHRDEKKAGMPYKIESIVNYIDSKGRRLRNSHYPLRLRIPVLRNSHLFQFCTKRLGQQFFLNRQPGLPWPQYTKLVFQQKLAPELLEAWNKLTLSLNSFKKETEKHNAELIIVLIPTVVQLVQNDPALMEWYSGVPAELFDSEEPNRKLKKLFHQLGIPCVDLMPFFKEWIESGQGTALDLYYKKDPHFTAKAQALAAKIIAAYLQES